jgi:hypothetical protein
MADQTLAYPVGRCKVDRLSEIVSLVEPGVIRSGEGYDELACMLIRPTHK